LPYVTVSLHKTNDNSVFKTVVTKEDGSFEMEFLSDQAFDLYVTNIGYAPIKKHLPASNKATVILNSVQLSPEFNTLKTVKVAARKSLVSYEADKLVYNVEDDPESNYLSSFEILRKMPVMFIDGEDNIELNGNSNFEVLINNRPSSFFVNNISDVFKNLPASSVKSIEIITNPPARYDAEGVGGIINIITYKKNLSGMMGTLRGGYSTPGGPTAGGSLTFKTGKIGFSGLGGYNQNTSPASTSSFNRVDKVNNTSMNQIGEGTSSSRSWNTGGEMNWEISDLNLLTLNYHTNHNDGNSTSAQRVALTDNTGQQIQSYRNESISNYSTPGYDFGMDYQRKFKKNDGQLLTASYKELRNSNTYTSESLITQKINALLPGGHSANDNSSIERTAQIDYVQPIKKHYLEIGVKTISRINNSSYVFERMDTTTGLYVADESLSNSYGNRQNIYAAYASLTLKAGKWMFRTGARAEETKATAQFHATGTAADQSYSNILPNLSISKRFGNTSNLSLSYSQRLQRPGLYYLNPYVNNRDPYNIYYGNPELQPTVTHVATLMFNTYRNGVSFNINLNHNYTGNSILRYTVIGTDTVARTTYGNIGNEQMDGLSLSTGFTLFKKISFNINTGGNYRKYTNTINSKLQTNEGFSYQLSGYAGFSFLKTWRTCFDASYASSNISFQSRSAGYFNHSISLNKGFLKNRKAELSISANNPFQPYRRNITDIEQEQFHITQQYQMLMRRFTFTFNYRFGKLNGGVRPKKTIQNDDVKEVR
jgi:outer membrane receptor protein involved in Fe transport